MEYQKFVAAFSTLDNTDDAPPFMPAVFQRTCAPTEELLLVDTCFDEENGGAIGCENVDVLVPDAGEFGKRCWLGRERGPSRAWLAWSGSHAPSQVVCCVGCRTRLSRALTRVQVEEVVRLRVDAVIPR